MKWGYGASPITSSQVCGAQQMWRGGLHKPIFIRYILHITFINKIHFITCLCTILWNGTLNIFKKNRFMILITNYNITVVLSQWLEHRNIEKITSRWYCALLVTREIAKVQNYKSISIPAVSTCMQCFPIDRACETQMPILSEITLAIVVHNFQMYVKCKS